MSPSERFFEWASANQEAVDAERLLGLPHRIAAQSQQERQVASTLRLRAEEMRRGVFAALSVDTSRAPFSDRL